MNQLQDLGLLALSGFFFLFYQKPDAAFICALLLCVILCCTGVFICRPGTRLILCMIFFVLGFLLPSLCFFYPTAVYLLCMDHRYLPAFSGILLYLFLIYRNGSHIFLFIFWGILAFLTALCLAHRTKKLRKLEQSLMRLRDDSTEKNLLLAEKNRALAEKQNYEIYAATLKERNRIAREIHDNVGHLLSRSILLTGAAKTISTETAVAAVLDNLEHSLNQAMTSIRTSVHDLHDESINLQEAVQGLISDFQFCSVTLDYDMEYEIPRDIKYCLISIIKEALSNIARHSNATQASITLREHPALYQLCITDNGTQLKSSFLLQDSSSGIGLANMKDRLAPLHGNLQIHTEKGFRLFITIPKEQEIIKEYEGYNHR